MSKVEPPEEKMLLVDEALGLIEVLKIYYRAPFEETTERQRKSLARMMSEIQFTLEDVVDQPPADRREHEDRTAGPRHAADLSLVNRRRQREADEELEDDRTLDN